MGKRSFTPTKREGAQESVAILKGGGTPGGGEF